MPPSTADDHIPSWPPPSPPPPAGARVMFRPGQGATGDGGSGAITVRLDGQAVRLTQAEMARLYRTARQNIGLHLQSIWAEQELEETPVVRDYLTVQVEGARSVERSIAHHSLEAIIAAGCRVGSARGTEFRRWATGILREYLTRGFVLDDERLKESRSLGADYFDEILERIRDIRASERRFDQKITDIYATSVDYAPDAEITRAFCATVQNKLHWSIHGHTAAEVVRSRAGATKPNMGLTTWKNAPGGPIRKREVSIARNYLTQTEPTALNRIVTMFLDYAEDQASRRRPMHMSDRIDKLNAFLEFNERAVLTEAVRISQAMATDHADREFEKHEAAPRVREVTGSVSDFDRFLRTRRDA